MRISTGAALLLSALLAGCGGEQVASRPAQETQARVGDAGVTLALPSGWHAATPDDRSVIDPVTRIVVASSPIQPNDSPCQIAHYTFAEDAVALVVVEWRSVGGNQSARPERFTTRELPIHPPPSIECFDGAGGSVHFVDEGRTFGGYLLVGERAPERLVAEARRVLDTLDVEPTAAGRRLARNGVSLAIPEGWDGRILFRDPAGSGGVVFQLANFELPPNEGLEQPRELPPGQEDPINAMDAGDVLVTVISDEGDGDAAPLPVTLDDLRLLPAGTPRIPRGHTLAEGSFCFGVRCIRIEVDFGGPPAPDLAERVNEVLTSLTVPAGEAGGAFADPQSDFSGPLPLGWHVIETQLTAVLYPRQVLALASFPLRQSEPDPECIPATLHEQMPAGGAAILVVEYTGAPEPLQADFPPRPDRFRLTDESFGVYECYGRGHALRFRERGRQLQFQVMLGERTGAKTRSEIAEILNGIRIGPASGA